MPSLIFRKGLDLKHAVAGMLADSYHSSIVEQVKADNYTHRAGRLTVHLAREFGFCYGVDRAVDYAYQTRQRFPDRRVFLTGEIIHNPHVNDKLRAMGIRFLTDEGEDPNELTASDVVILPAFGVTVAMLQQFDRRGCTMIDTTCGSVLNVWKNVRRYAEGGYTSVIHGKVWHEETQATASQAVQYGGKYLVAFDRPEVEIVCDYIRRGGDRDAFMGRFEKATSPGFDPDRDLQHIGLANQTTMLMSESLEIGEMIRAAMRDRYADAALAEHYQAFDTICSATQDRQDAVVALLHETPVDLMVVIGGYNSSNTANLAHICAASRPTYHIADPDCLVSAREIRHRRVGSKTEVTTPDWLPAEGPVSIGLTSGASTPDNLVGAAISKLSEFCA
ncbi:MAG TPA: 4-hydroxy-3-methylbut-2-enyl diphosphate reductase [Vicinamibacterales bacterium]|jgi:4-hydroxy-3-methylbut-2-enyl diphosphate reductase|nr:4-hydroxy-3-methylbut-2-enyl diphosphate reductase [Vicinamibacterales bacterium]